MSCEYAETNFKHVSSSTDLFTAWFSQRADKKLLRIYRGKTINGFHDVSTGISRKLMVKNFVNALLTEFLVSKKACLDFGTYKDFAMKTVSSRQPHLAACDN